MTHLELETRMYDLSSVYMPISTTFEHKDLAFIKGALYSYFVAGIIVDNKSIKILKFDYF